MKNIIKKIVSERAILFYHFLIAWLAAFYCGFPAKKMVVIGVTGTKGKTSTVNFIWSCLQAGGYKTGIISTANLRIGQKESMNPYHMTMPGHFAAQKLLAKMVKDGCKYCVVETSSEGIKQSRHIGMYYDVAVFTNLTPEHLPSHQGSFEEYKKAKGKLFESLSRYGDKMIDNKKIEKVIIVNNDKEHKDYFLQFPADRKITFGLEPGADYLAHDIKSDSCGVEFKVKTPSSFLPLSKGEEKACPALDAGVGDFQLQILGRFNVYNALPAIIIARLAGISNDLIAKGLRELCLIPGRMEIIDEGQNFKVIVDYAHEKQSMTNVLDTAREISAASARVIVLLGAEGGGRDKTKRPVMGEIAAKKADFVIVSNVDPYDDDPIPILEDIAQTAEKFGKVKDKDLFVIEDRRQGIKKALGWARAGDIVVITGKGAEQSMILPSGPVPWDDRVVVREELKIMKTKN